MTPGQVTTEDTGCISAANSQGQGRERTLSYTGCVCQVLVVNEQTSALDSLVQVECRETGVGPMEGSSMVKGRKQKSWGREIEGAGLAQSGKGEAAMSPWPPTF